MSIFNQVSMPRNKRNKFNLSHDRKFSLKFGVLTPVLCMEVVPSDIISVDTTSVIRFAPMLAPVMHQVNVYTHYFFVPNRIVWENWEDFITGGEDGLAEPEFPTIGYTSRVGDLADYLGLGYTELQTSTEPVSAIPFAGYQKIWNDYYRDQNLQDEFDSNLIDGANVDWPLAMIRNRAWQHDYFTSALPWTQKGQEVTMPLGAAAPIARVDPLENDILFTGTELTGSAAPTTPWLSGVSPLTKAPTGDLTIDADQDVDAGGSGKVALDNSYNYYANTQNWYADLGAATAASINDLRRAFALQSWLEKNARGGSRYFEFLQVHFGVKSPDARLQRPEFLGGGKQRVQFSEVLQTSAMDTEPTPQGNMAGHGIASGKNAGFKYRVVEHGYIFGIMSIMPKPAYQQGTPRHFSKFDRFDYFFENFEQIGEQPIYNREIYNDNNSSYEPEGIFGYTPRYAEYKYLPSTVHGEFKTSLNFWHMGRIFDGPPHLNEDFITMDDAEVSRVFAVEDAEKLYCYLHNKVKAIRPMRYFANPSIR